MSYVNTSMGSTMQSGGSIFSLMLGKMFLLSLVLLKLRFGRSKSTETRNHSSKEKKNVIYMLYT